MSSTSSTVHFRLFMVPIDERLAPAQRLGKQHTQEANQDRQVQKPEGIRGPRKAEPCNNDEDEDAAQSQSEPPPVSRCA